MKSALRFLLALLVAGMTACSGLQDGVGLDGATVTPEAPGELNTPVPDRPEYDPGQLVDYVARSGDTLPGLAARFNTTIEEIRAANPVIPADTTSMPPGMPMQIPIYFRTSWGNAFLILPDSQFVNGPGAIDFDITAYVQASAGWLKDFRAYAQGGNYSGAEVVQIVATNYSISPRVLLAVLEYEAGALSQPVAPAGRFTLGVIDYRYAGLFMQLIWVANVLNHGFYGWRSGLLTEFELEDGRFERPDPWQTAGSVAFQYYFSQTEATGDYQMAIGEEGMARVYENLFGDPWAVDEAHIPVSLQQPVLSLPFGSGETWAFTGGPHTGWGSLLPWAGLDFAPGAESGGCVPTNLPAVAMAEGVVVRSETGVVMLDLDGDGDERTGWNLLYLHVATTGRAEVGAILTPGEVVGYPSCEGGTATGSHVHIARKYNGEWIPADGAIPFNMEGWVAHNGEQAYEGTLTRFNQEVIACTCSIASSQLRAGE